MSCQFIVPLSVVFPQITKKVELRIHIYLKLVLQYAKSPILLSSNDNTTTLSLALLLTTLLLLALVAIEAGELGLAAVRLDPLAISVGGLLW